MADTMKAAVVRELGKPLAIEDVPVPQPNENQILVVLKRITVRGSIVGTRQDLEEALAFAGSWAASAPFSWDKLENINDVFARMEDGKLDGRIVVALQ